MDTNGIKDFIETLKKINGKNVWIYIQHDLYGDQNLKCSFKLLSDKERLGFVIGAQEIYMEKSEIVSVGVQNNLFYFADELMCIKIREM